MIMPAIGDQAPNIRLIDTEKTPVELASLRGQTVILAFYPAAFSGICDKEMCTFNDSLAALNQANATVIGVSPDSPFANQKFAEVNGIKFKLLSDLHLDAARAFDVFFENFAFIEGYTACNRAVFIIDGNGTVAYKWVGEHPGMEPDYAEVIAAAQAV